MTNIKDISKEIQGYYKISMFVNKYITLISTFLLSLAILLLTNVESSNILAYSTDINRDFTRKANNVNLYQNDVNRFNKQEKTIKVVVLLKKPKYKKNIISLGYGIFTAKLKDGTVFYLPSNVSFTKETYNTLYNSKNPGLDYIRFIKKVKKNNDKFKLHKFKTLKNKDVIDKYDLSCIDSIMSSTPFCNYNKSILLDDLENSSMFDVSGDIYKKLINVLDKKDEEKCSILVSIYFKKFNYKNIGGSIDEYCDLKKIKKIKFASSLLKFLQEDKLELLLSKYNSDDVYTTQLVNQFYKIVNKQGLAKDLMNINIKLIRKGLKSSRFDVDLATITVSFLKEMKSRIDASKSSNKGMISDINELLKGSDVIEKGLLSFVDENNNITLNQHFIAKTYHHDMVSNREKLQNLVKNNYRKKFVITEKIKTIENGKKLIVKGNVNIIYKDGNKIKKGTVPVKFIITKLTDYTFNIKEPKITNDKMFKYVGHIKNFKSFDDFYEYLKNKMYAPLVDGDWGKGDKTISLCEKFKFKNKTVKCKNGRVYLDAKSLGFEGKIKVALVLSNSLKIKKILFTKSYTWNLKNFKKEKWTIPTSLLKKYTGEELNKMETKSYNRVVDMLKKAISSMNKKYLSFKMGLNKKQIEKLETRFKRFLGTNIVLIRKNKDKRTDVYFKLSKILFIGDYDIEKNVIYSLRILDLKKQDEDYTCKGFDLKLSTVNEEILNNIRLNPLSFLEKKCPKIIQKYKDDKEHN